MQGGYGSANYNYTEKLGVSLFFQSITTLIVGPCTGYASVAFGYLGDNIR
jgi:hypothetical protein